MATNGTPPPEFKNSDLMNYVVRMVIPMRREFACSLDVTHFLHDFAYAKEIIEQAKASKDARLRDYATYLESKMLGPRNAATNPPTASAATAEVATHPPPAQAPSPAAGPTSSELTEAEMRARMMSKYKSGLR